MNVAVNGALRVSDALCNRDEPVRARHRKQVQGGGVENGEDGGVGADAEGEGEDGDCREARGLAQHAEAEAQILREAFDEADAAGLAALFLDAFEAAEFESRAAESFGARDAGAEEIFSVGVDVGAKLGVHVGLHVGATQDGAGPGAETSEKCHVTSSSSWCETVTRARETRKVEILRLAALAQDDDA